LKTIIISGEENENLISISGYEENAIRAKEDILAIVRNLDDLVREEIEIDARVHSRLIGGRGRNIRKIMDDFKVDIKFPRNDDPNPNLVIISGQGDNVADAREHLLNIAEEYVRVFLFSMILKLNFFCWVFCLTTQKRFVGKIDFRSFNYFENNINLVVSTQDH